MKYIITIEETVAQDFEVEADDIRSALRIAEKNYKDVKFVLEPGELMWKQISARNEDETEYIDWYEF